MKIGSQSARGIKDTGRGRYIRLERSLKKERTFHEFAKVLGKYIQMKDAEPVYP